MRETYELIKPIVDALPKTIKVSSVTDNLDGTYTLTTCNTLHLQASNRIITIDGNPYTVKEVFHNSVIILEGQTVPNVTEFDIYPIKFFHGTIKTTNIELNQVDTSEDKFPMVYLYEVLEEENSHNVSELTGRTVDVRLYFLTENDWRNLNSKERQDLGVKPMRNAFDAFMRLLETSDVCTDVPELSRTKPYGVFGRENEQGIFKTIFDADLSGLGVRMVIPFKRVYCECSDFSEYFFQFINEGGNKAKQFICQTLPECQTIQQIESTLENHEERIEALEQNPGGGLTCETVLECQNVIDAFNGKVDKEEGKGLSENDFTTTLKNAYDAAVQWIIDNGANILNHISNFSNPHNVTKSQVGLGNVPNLDTTLAVSQTHTHSNKTILDAITEAFTTTLKNAYDGAVTWISTNGATLIAHLTDFNNPHQTTAAQVGAVELKYKPFTNGIQVNHTGTTAKTLIATVTIPAPTLAVGDAYEIKAWFSRPAGDAATATFFIDFDAEENLAQTATTTQRQIRLFQSGIVATSTLIQSSGSTANTGLQGTGNVNANQRNNNIDITQPLTINIYAQLGNSNDTAIFRYLSFRIV